MKDIVLVNVPYTQIEVPPLGLAVLKGAIESEGMSCHTIDLGMDLFNYFNKDRHKTSLMQQYFAELELDQSREFNVELHCQELLDRWARKILALNSRWIGFSVFSYYSHTCAYLLAEKIRELNPTVKIVGGGTGMGTVTTTILHEHISIEPEEKKLKLGDLLKKRGLIDVTIYGDGEQALINLLRDGKSTITFQIADYKREDFAFANFDDFDLYSYEGQVNQGFPQLPIFSSKGCVRNCDFCDVNTIQGRFRFRSGANIVKEMIHLADRYGIRDFLFLDSLVNGSMKSMREWVTSLADYNRSNPHKRITWSASGWICRPIGQIPVDFYDTLAESGLKSVTIGAETGSNHVLYHMDKKTNVEALYFEAAEFAKRDIKFITLIIIGHWSEKWEDFLDTAKMLLNLTRYNKTGHHLSTDANVFHVISGTPAEQNTKDNQLTIHSPKIWWTPLNPDLTLKERFFRLLLLHRLMDLLGIPKSSTLPNITDFLERNRKNIETFYQSCVNHCHKDIKNSAQYYYYNFERFVDLILQNNKNFDRRFSVDLELESSSVNSLPVISIQFNDQIIYQRSVEDGRHNLHFDLSQEKQNRFAITFSNKDSNDTIVDTQGNIIVDKHVKILGMKVNDIDLTQDPEFFYNKLAYTIDGKTTQVHQGFWSDQSSLIMQFPDPFLFWYYTNSKNYSHLDTFIINQTTKPGQRIFGDKPDLSEQNVDNLLRFLHSLDH